MELRIHYRTSEGVYRTEDGRYQIERGVISTGWCECVIIPCSHGPEGGYMDTHGWWVWDNKHDDYAFDHETWNTMREARAALANLYANMTEPPPRRVKFPRPTKGDTTDGAVEGHVRTEPGPDRAGSQPAEREDPGAGAAARVPARQGEDDPVLPNDEHPRSEGRSVKCKACEFPDQYRQHACGLKKLQDMLSFGPKPKRRRR